MITDLLTFGVWKIEEKFEKKLTKSGILLSEICTNAVTSIYNSVLKFCIMQYHAFFSVDLIDRASGISQLCNFVKLTQNRVRSPSLFFSA